MKRLAMAVAGAALLPAAALGQAGGTDTAALLRQSADLIARQRPGEALAILERAGELGGSRVIIAIQRGIAFDLQGDAAAAQRAYRAALQANAGDHAATRHMALSLALSGDNGVALAMLDRLGVERPENRRTLALVHALGGRQADAAELAVSSLSIDDARQMRAFYARLPQLSATARAYAVHFGALPGEMPRTTLATAPAATSPAAVPGIAATPVARLWVQFASIADPARLTAEWDRIRRLAGEALNDRTPHVQRINGMNRLLIGPFDSEADARAAVLRLKSRRVSAILNRTAADADIGPIG